jgi:hypothetical protein
MWKIVTLKYDRDGVQQWAQVYTSGGGDVVNDLALDASGNVIVTGTGYSGSQDYLTLKYNSAGSQVGTARRYNPSGSSGYDEGHRVITDGSNGFYVVGTCQPATSGSNYDIGVVKYGGIAGTQQWAYTFSAPGPWTDAGTGICRDSAGFIYVIGYSWMSGSWIPGLTTSNTDIAIIKLRSTGDTVWTRHYSGPSNREDYAMAVAYDGHGGILIGGMTYDVASPYDANLTIMRMDTAGAVLWAQTYDGPGGADPELGSSLAVDTAGNAYVAGSLWYNWSSNYFATKDMIVLRYDINTGNQTWSASYNGTSNLKDEFATGVAVDKTGNVVIAGQSAETSGGYNLTVVRYSQTTALPVQASALTAKTVGQSVALRWSSTTETDNAGWEVERRNVIGDRDKVGNTAQWITVGWVDGAGTSTAPREYAFSDHTAIPTIQSPIARFAYRLKQLDRSGAFAYSHEVEVEVGSAPRELTLGRNYPNPFNPSTELAFSIPEDGRVTLEVYDMLGRQVASLVDGEAKAGYVQRATFDATTLASGLYIARLEFGGRRLVQKMQLVR